MKIGFNYKSIKNFVINSITQMSNLFSDALNTIQSDINVIDSRVTTIENSSGWVEITSSNGQDAEITQEFSEIRLLAKCTNANYSVTYSYDSTIFHNTPGNAPTYMICGNPTENNYGCKFKYMLASNNKQYVTVDSCFSGSTYDAYEFRAWIKRS